MSDNYRPFERSTDQPGGPTKSARDEGGGVMSDRVTPRVAGADVGPANPLPTTTASDRSELYLQAIMMELRALRTILATAYGLAALFEPLPDFERDPNVY